jgi:hypothetical protein
MPQQKTRDPIIDVLVGKKCDGSPPNKSETLYRDGKPVTDRPREDVAEIWSQHNDPGHPDYNPSGATPVGIAVATSKFVEKAVEEHRQKRKGGKSRRGSKGLLERLIDRLQPSSLSELVVWLEPENEYGEENDRIADLCKSLSDPIDFQYLGMDERTDPKGCVRYRTAGRDKSVSFKRLKNLLGERQKRLKNPLSEKQ